MWKLFVIGSILLSFCLGCEPRGPHSATDRALDPCEAECDFCIDALPYQADKSGTHCLSGDLTFSSTEGAAIRVGADDVVVDLRGHVIKGPGDGGTGVSAGYQTRVTVRNGTVTGFERAVSIAVGGEGHRVENVHAVGNFARGISVNGPYSIVRGCTVAHTGGAVSDVGIIAVSGIDLSGAGVAAIDNTVYRTFTPGSNGTVVALLVSQVPAVLSNNRVIDVSGGDKRFGILCNGSGVERVVRDNTVIAPGSDNYNGCLKVGTNHP
jgi:hypothetical protein